MVYAAGQGRAILTYNSKDFAPLYQEWWWTGRDHFGIIVSEQLPVGELVQRVLRLLNSITADEMKNNFRHLAEFSER